MIKRAVQAAAEAARAVGLAFAAYLGGTAALAAYAGTYEPRLALAVVGVSLLAFFLLDLLMLRRGRSRGA